MRYLIWILVLFAAAVALAIALHNPSYVLLVYPPYRIELSLTLFMVIYMLTLILGYGLLRLVLAAIHLPSFVKNFRAQRLQTKARKLLDDALTAFFEGRYSAAEKTSARAIEMGGTSELLPIIAAHAAHELRKFDKRDAYLAGTNGKSFGETTMRLMAKTQFQLDQKQPQAALNTLKEFDDSGIHKHVGALSLELKAQQQARNWDAVLEIASKLRNHDVIDKAAADQLRQQAWMEKLREPALDRITLHALWKSIPKEFRQRSKIAAVAARAFSKLDDCQSAHRLLSDALDVQWDSELVALYGDCQAEDAVAQIEQAEKWLTLHKQDAGLLLALGKLCMHQKLWGKAQNYLEASLSMEPGYAVYTALGQLAEMMGKQEQALVHFQKAMQHRQQNIQGKERY